MTTDNRQGPLLEVRDVRTWFPIRRGVIAHTVGHVRAVDGVSFSLAPGEALGLVGESGCGKTTLARTILGLDPIRSGEVLFEGRPLHRLPAAERRVARRHLQIVFQDPFSSLNPRMTAIDIITEGLVAHGLIARSARESSARQLLTDVGLDADALHRYPHEFSGGQRQRLCIARAISFRPRLIVCDEAVSALDVSVQAQIINLLGDLRKRYGLAYLFISHDLGVVRQVCDRVAVMYMGEIVELGDSADVIGQPRHPYTRALVSAIPRVRAAARQRIVLTGDVPSPAHPPPGCRFHTRCPHAIDACRASAPALEEAGPGHRVACLRTREPCLAPLSSLAVDIDPTLNDP